MIFHYSDYIDFLNNYLQEKKDFSLRQFAAEIKIDHSTLSRVLSKKRKIPISIASNIAKKIELTPVEAQYFMLLVEYDHVITERAKTLIANEIIQIQKQRTLPQVSKEVFPEVFNVLNVSILEMSGLENFELTPENVSKTLGVNLDLVQISFDALIKEGFLTKADRIYSLASKKKTHFKINTKDEGLQKYLDEVLDKAKAELIHGEPKKRLYRTRIVPMPHSKRGEVCALVDSFFGKLQLLLDQSENNDDLVCFNFNFFSLLNKK